MSLANNKRKPTYQYFDSFSLRQAHARNYALDKHHGLVAKSLDKEAKRQVEEISKECHRIEKDLDDIHTIFPIKINALEKVYQERDTQMNEVYLNIVNCYMRRQYRNKAHWQDMVTAKVISEKPVKSQDHLDFVKDVFPEIYHRQVDMGYLYNHNPRADIYEYGKAAHDRKCLSRKVVPVGQASGAFPAHKPINIRHWKPADEYILENDIRFPKMQAHLYEFQPGKVPKRSSTDERVRSPSIFANARRITAKSLGAGQRLTTAVSEMAMIREVAGRSSQ